MFCFTIVQKEMWELSEMWSALPHPHFHFIHRLYALFGIFLFFFLLPVPYCIVLCVFSTSLFPNIYIYISFSDFIAHLFLFPFSVFITQYMTVFMFYSFSSPLLLAERLLGLCPLHLLSPAEKNRGVSWCRARANTDIQPDAPPSSFHWQLSI